MNKTDDSAFASDLSAFSGVSDITDASTGSDLVEAAKREAATDASAVVKSENELYAKTLDGIIQKSRLAALYNPYPKPVLKFAVAAWLEIFTAAKIPRIYANRCYLAAKTRRQDILNETGAATLLDADFIAAQWRATVRDKVQSENAHRLIAPVAVVNCPDCFGNSTGRKYTGGKLTGVICGHENAPAFDD